MKNKRLLNLRLLPIISADIGRIECTVIESDRAKRHEEIG